MIALKTIGKKALCFALVIILSLAPALSFGALAVNYPDGVTQADCEAAIPKLNAVIPFGSLRAEIRAGAPVEGYTLDDFEITVTDRDGKAYTNVTKPEMSGKRIRVKIGGVLSPQMGRDFHITVTLKNDSTKTATWTRSIITCAYEIQKGNAAGSSACNMAQALYQYYLAAADVWPNMK